MTSVTKTIPTKLAIENAHPSDEFITFEEGPHIYTVHGEQGYTSVTTWNHHHFSNFDADKVIDGMMRGKSWNDPTYKYYGMTREEIKKMWDDKRIFSSGAGTQMHYDIECYFNGLEVNNDSVEYGYFKNFVKDFPHLKAYRTEWMVYYEELKLSGSIDMLFENPDGTLQIYDWKRCGEIKYEDNYNKFAHTPCISHFPDTNFWHYSLQLNVYKTILEHKYGKKITDMYLVCMHPDNDNYQHIRVDPMEDIMEELFAMRKHEIEEMKSEK